MFELQMFGVEIEGIDEDILAEIGEETVEEPKEVEEPQQSTEEPQEPTVDADNENKQVEVQEEEEGAPVPYARFKQVYYDKKNADNRIKELEEALAKAKAETPAQPVVQQEQPKPQYNAEKMQQITQLALERARERLNLSEDDVANMDYNDDPVRKVMYNNAIQEEVNTILADIDTYRAKQNAFEAEVNATKKEFDEYSVKFASYADSNERWDFISNKNFANLPERKQNVLKEAFERLQAGRGTYQDMDSVANYINEANALWENRIATNNKKINEAQKLPRASAVTGATGADTVYTLERIADILNSGDAKAWDEVPESIKRQVMSGYMK